MEAFTIFIRLGITFLLAFCFGLEREISKRPIGFGTFIFVSIGSTALALAAITIQAENPLPFLGSIITGIGFLGAGALIKNAEKISGFTSAASIWLFAIIGILVGIGEYLSMLILYGTAWVVVLFNQFLHRSGAGSYHRRITIVCKKIFSAEEFRKHVPYLYELQEIDISKKTKMMNATISLHGSEKKVNKVVQSLYKQPWVMSIRWE